MWVTFSSPKLPIINKPDADAQDTSAKPRTVNACVTFLTLLCHSLCQMANESLPTPTQFYHSSCLKSNNFSQVSQSTRTARKPDRSTHTHIHVHGHAGDRERAHLGSVSLGLMRERSKIIYQQEGSEFTGYSLLLQPQGTRTFTNTNTHRSH